MRQLELFSRSQLSSLRDRTASRNYSVERDQFRREHQRHREWGLRQRHGRRSMYLRIHGDITPPADRDTSRPASTPVPEPADTPVPEPADTEQLSPQAPRANISRTQDLANVRDRQAGEADVTPPTETTTSADQIAPGAQIDPATRPNPARGQTAPRLFDHAAPLSGPTPPIRPAEPPDRRADSAERTSPARQVRPANPPWQADSRSC